MTERRNVTMKVDYYGINTSSNAVKPGHKCRVWTSGVLCCVLAWVLILAVDDRMCTRAYVVFVHGLRGGPYKSWRIADDKSSTKSGLVEKIDQEAGRQGTFWPREWLSADFPQVRLFTLKYKIRSNKSYTVVWSYPASSGSQLHAIREACCCWHWGSTSCVCDSQSDKNLRLIRSSLPEAVEACIDAAGYKFDVSRQRTLLRAASYGQAFCRLSMSW